MSTVDLKQDEIPRGDVAGLKKYAKYDLVSGFLVFLIALPLCLSISIAYGYPAISGIFTAIIGGILTTFISNSELTIKGPAAGLIVVAAGCMMDFGWSGIPGDMNYDAFQAALGIGVAAGIIQILFGVFRAGALGDFFPSSVVHGMLAAIGAIIIIKMLPSTLGVAVKGTPLALIKGAPEIFTNYHADIAAVGVVSLLIMFLWPLMKNVKILGSIPSALIVLIVAVPMARALDLGSEHTIAIKLEQSGHGVAPAPAAVTPTDELESDTLVRVPAFGETFDAITFPEFSALREPKAWKWVLMFALIGTIESMLSAKAIDVIDPWQRKTNLDRDNLAVGIANTVCAFIGGAPMISEIVRSKANLDNGARTRFADFYHGIFLLVFVALLPFVIGMIPIAALTAMLIYTGYRLANPREFMHAFEIGTEQLIIFSATIVGVFATNLLEGVIIGIVVKLVIHVVNGVPIRSLFKAYLDAEKTDDNTYTIRAEHSAVFSNWIPLKRQIYKLGVEGRHNVIVDLSGTKYVDHSVMTRLQEMKAAFKQHDLEFEIAGLDEHRALSKHPESARKRKNGQQTAA